MSWTRLLKPVALAVGVTLAVGVAPTLAAPLDDDPLGAAPLDAGPLVDGPEDLLTPTSDVGPQVYEGTLTPEELGRVRAAGLDGEDIALAPAGAAGTTRAEVVMPAEIADRLVADGVPLTLKNPPAGSAEARTLALETEDAGDGVFRPWSGPGNLREEFIQVTEDHPDLTELVTIGQSVQGEDILAVRVTRDADDVRQGRRPAVLYVSMQHAREWITTEMTRRLLHHYLDSYDTDPEIRRLVDTTELWFVPVANPDGYDYTFTEGNRLWRKNLADNDGDGQITNADGVDPNRNWPYRWGYDNEGSSPDPFSNVYRGPSPGSEPETQALDELMGRIDFAFLVNYHSAAELMLYGTGWQVATSTPDDLVYEALAGTDDNTAVPGYDPDLSAELYTTNGETTEHAHQVHDTLGFTPEMSTCATASAVDPDDAFEPEDCQSVFNFPDSEPLIQAEFEVNVPFAVAVAQSAHDPGDPVSPVGIDTPDFVVDSFDVSYGSPQTVAVTASRDVRFLLGRYRVNDGPTRFFLTREYGGGERYGDESAVYYAERRGRIRGAEPGDSVEVWFSGWRFDDGFPLRRESERFTYTVAEDGSSRGDDVLVVSNEDYGGVNPTYPDSVTSPQYAADYVTALEASGANVSVWDVTAQGVPHDLGVLDHFDAVVWYSGDNRLTQDPEDEITEYLGSEFPDLSVAEREQFLTIALRDYVNDGGNLLVTGETAGYFGLGASAFGGIYYSLDGAPEEQCVVTDSPFFDCLLLSDDFFQYYLGAFGRQPNSSVGGFAGTDEPLAGLEAVLDGTATNPLDEAGAFTVTSEVLPESEFPQFASRPLGVYASAGVDPFAPVEGDWYAGAVHADQAYMRLSQTVDLTGVAAGQDADLTAQLSYDLETGYDNVLVEARPVGTEDWTTLPEAGGLSSTATPPECEAGFLLALHPFLESYLTPATADQPCQPVGTTGEWHALTGNSGGWQPAAFDLSAYAGSEVEVSISYVTDPASGGVGVFVDDTAVTVDGDVVSSEGFEAGLGAWSVTGPPASSPGNGRDWERSEGLVPPAQAAVATEDTVLLGFGIEQIPDPDVRAEVLGRVMTYLLD